MNVAELEAALAELVERDAPQTGELAEARRGVQRRVHRDRRRVGLTALVGAAAAAVVVLGLVNLVGRPGTIDVVAEGGEAPTSAVTTSSTYPSTGKGRGPAETAPRSGEAESPPGPTSSTVDAIHGHLPRNTGGKAALVDTGTSVVIYGGEDRGVGDVGPPIERGWRYELGADRWTAVPPAPLQHDAQLSTSGAWTGEEVLVWNRFGAASYNPETGVWRAHPGFPAGAPRAVWSGERLKAWEQGVSYDPMTGTSSPLPASPIPPDGSPEATALWAGGGIYVIEDRAVWRYDSGADHWRKLPNAPPGSARFTGAAWDGERLVVVGTDREVIVYDPQRDQWVIQTLAPLAPVECRPHAIGVPGRVYVDGCSGIAELSADGWATALPSSGQMLVAGGALMVLSGGLAEHPLPLPEQVLLGGAVAAVPEGWTLLSLNGRDHVNSPTERLTSPTGPIWATAPVYVEAELRTRDGRHCTLRAQHADYSNEGRSFRTSFAAPGGYVEASCDDEADLVTLRAAIKG